MNCRSNKHLLFGGVGVQSLSNQNDANRGRRGEMISWLAPVIFDIVSENERNKNFKQK